MKIRSHTAEKQSTVFCKQCFSKRQKGFFGNLVSASVENETIQQKLFVSQWSSRSRIQSKLSNLKLVMHFLVTNRHGTVGNTLPKVKNGSRSGHEGNFKIIQLVVENTSFFAMVEDTPFRLDKCQFRPILLVFWGSPETWPWSWKFPIPQCMPTFIRNWGRKAVLTLEAVPYFGFESYNPCRMEILLKVCSSRHPSRWPSQSQRPASTTIDWRSPFPLGLCSSSASLSEMRTWEHKRPQKAAGH